MLLGSTVFYVTLAPANNSLASRTVSYVPNETVSNGKVQNCNVSVNRPIKSALTSRLGRFSDYRLSKFKESVGSVGLSPDFAGSIGDELELCPLLVFGEEIAFHRGGKSALRANCKLI